MIEDFMDDGVPFGTTMHQSIIIYEQEWKGKRRKFISPNIPKDAVTLEFLIGSKKTTTLYVHRNNPELYFFDLGFLKN